MIKSSLSRGAGIVEVIVAVLIVSIGLTAALSAYGFYLKLARANTATIQAAFLLEEGQEAMRSLRDSGWAANIQPLVAGTNYYLVFDGGANRWTLSTANTLIDGIFERSIVVGDVYRDGVNNIVATGGTFDPKTKKITVTVSQTTVATYLTNIFNN